MVCRGFSISLALYGILFHFVCVFCMSDNIHAISLSTCHACTWRFEGLSFHWVYLLVVVTDGSQKPVRCKPFHNYNLFLASTFAGNNSYSSYHGCIPKKTYPSQKLARRNCSEEKCWLHCSKSTTHSGGFRKM